MYSQRQSQPPSSRSGAVERETHLCKFNSPDENYFQHHDNYNIPQANQTTFSTQAFNNQSNPPNNLTPEQIKMLEPVLSPEQLQALVISLLPPKMTKSSINENSSLEINEPRPCSRRTRNSMYSSQQLQLQSLIDNMSLTAPNYDCRCSGPVNKEIRLFHGCNADDNFYPPLAFLKDYIRHSTAARHGTFFADYQKEIRFYLQGVALTWLDLVGVRCSDFDEFSQIFLCAFRKGGSDDKAIWDKIDQYHQGETQSFIEYVGALHVLFEELFYTPTEEMKIDAVLNNLQTDYYEWIQHEQFNTLQELALKMCEVENLVNDDRRRRAADQREEINYSERENLRQLESKNHARAENFEFLTHLPSRQTDYENQRLQPPSLPPRDGMHVQVQITARYAPASSQQSDTQDQHNFAPSTNFETRRGTPYREISPVRSESRASSETEIKVFSEQNFAFNDNGIKGGHFTHFARSCPVTLIDSSKTINSVSNPVICETSEQEPRRQQHPDPDNEKTINIPHVKLPPDFDNLDKHHQPVENNCPNYQISDPLKDRILIQEVKSAVVNSSQLAERQNKIDLAVLSNIAPLPVEVTEKLIKCTKTNFVPRVGVVNVYPYDFNLNESLNWLFETNNEDKNPISDSKYDKITNLVETVQPEISAPKNKLATINSFKEISTPEEKMFYIYLAQTFSIICESQIQKSMNLIRNYQKLGCLSFEPPSPKVPVPKLVLMPKLFHGKFPVKIPFKIQFKQLISYKLTFSDYFIEETSTHSQREMSLALKTDAPAYGIDRKLIFYSCYYLFVKTIFMIFGIFGLIISTVRIQVHNLKLPGYKHLNFYNTNLMFAKVDKPYENDAENVRMEIEETRLNGWPPPYMHVKS
jgi:hypothetical protein